MRRYGQPLIGREPEVTKNDRPVSGDYLAMISVANLHSIRLDTPQNTRIGSIERAEWKILYHTMVNSLKRRLGLPFFTH